MLVFIGKPRHGLILNSARGCLSLFCDRRARRFVFRAGTFDTCFASERSESLCFIEAGVSSGNQRSGDRQEVIRSDCSSCFLAFSHDLSDLIASGSNLSPWHRVSVYLSLCAVSNHIRRFKRPEYIAQRDFTPIACLPDDCLLREHPVELPWKNGMPASALVTSLAEI